MAAAPFGFSVGDFIAAIELTHKAAKALRNTSGASGQYQQALLDLELIGSVLRRVQGLAPASASQELIRAIQLCGLACQVPLEHFLQKIKKLEPHLDFDRTSSSADFLNIKKSTNKLRWAIVLEQDVAKLKASIGPVIEIINTLLQLESLERSTTTQGCVERILDQTGRALPVVQQIATFLQSNVATKQHVQDVLPLLAQLGRGLSEAATARQVKSMAFGLTGLSGRLDGTATTDQANGLVTLVEDIKKGVESSNLMLTTLIHRTPHTSGSIIQTSTITTSDDLKQSLRSSGTNLSQRSTLAVAWQSFLGSLRHALHAILLFCLWLNPAVRLCLRSISTVSRSPAMLLDSNITFVDALNREFSLQYQHFRYWPVVSAWLRCQFRDCPGTLRIAHNRFAVFKEMKVSGRGVMIPFEEWEQMVRPGQRVLMSMYVGHQNSTRGHWPLRNVCPSCGLEDSRSLNDSVWTICADCGQSLLRLDLEQTKSTIEQGALHLVHPATPADRDIFDCSEISAFSRVHHLYQRLSTERGSQKSRAALNDDWQDLAIQERRVLNKLRTARRKELEEQAGSQTDAAHRANHTTADKEQRVLNTLRTARRKELEEQARRQTYAASRAGNGFRSSDWASWTLPATKDTCPRDTNKSHVPADSS